MNRFERQLLDAGHRPASGLQDSINHQIAYPGEVAPSASDVLMSARPSRELPPAVDVELAMGQALDMQPAAVRDAVKSEVEKLAAGAPAPAPGEPAAQGQAAQRRLLDDLTGRHEWHAWNAPLGGTVQSLVENAGYGHKLDGNLGLYAERGVAGLAGGAGLLAALAMLNGGQQQPQAVIVN